LKEEKEKKDADDKLLKTKQEQAAREKAEEILKAKTTINFVVKQIEKCTDNIWNVFNTFDVDKNGSIDWTELKRVFDYCNVSLQEKEFDKVFDMIDLDGNKKISY